MEEINWSLNDNTTLSAAFRRLRKWAQPAYMRLLATRMFWDSNQNYGATDGRRLLLSPEGMQRIDSTSDPVGYCAFLLLHEALHCQLNHGVRLRKLENHRKANEAADYVINSIITQINEDAVYNGAGSPPFPFIPNVLDDPELAGDLTAEQLYQYLVRQPDDQPIPPQPQPHPDDTGMPDDDEDEDEDEDEDITAGGSPDSDDDADEDIDAGGDGEPTDSDDGEESDDVDGSGSGDEIDDDADDDGGTGASGDSGGDDDGGQESNSDADILGNDWVGTGAEDTMEPELDADETMDEVKDELEEIASKVELDESINEQAGVTEGMAGMDRVMAQRRADNSGSWLQEVCDWMSERCSSGWDNPFNAPVYTSAGLVSVGRGSKNMGRFVVAFDVSYSVPEPNVEAMLGEIQFILDELRPEVIYVLEVTDVVREVWELHEGDVAPEKLNYGGFTAFKPIHDWVAELDEPIDGLIHMTDGHGSWNFDEPQYPCLGLDWSGMTRHYPAWMNPIVMEKP